MKPRLTVEQIKNILIQAQAQQQEDPNDFFASMCEELAEDLLYWREVTNNASEQGDVRI